MKLILLAALAVCLAGCSQVTGGQVVCDQNGCTLNGVIVKYPWGTKAETLPVPQKLIVPAPVKTIEK